MKKENNFEAKIIPLAPDFDNDDFKKLVLSNFWYIYYRFKSLVIFSCMLSLALRICIFVVGFVLWYTIKCIVWTWFIFSYSCSITLQNFTWKKAGECSLVRCNHNTILVWHLYHLSLKLIFFHHLLLIVHMKMKQLDIIQLIEMIF